MRNSRKYVETVLENMLPPVPENERVYLNVPYKNRGFAKAANCGFDAKKKLWFAEQHNSFLDQLIKMYGINEATSEHALNLLKEL